MQHDTNAIETANMHLQMTAEQMQSQTFFLLANVAAYDPTTNKIKAVIGNYTNDGQTGLETGWIQLNTPWSGTNFGFQQGPYGGATPTDPTGQMSGAIPEQVLLLVIGRDTAFYIVGALTYNNKITPPGNDQDIIDDWGNANRVQFQSGECIIRHSSGTYIFMKQDGSVSIVATTSPQKPYTEPSMTDISRTATYGSLVNADTQVQNPTTAEATTNIAAVVGIQAGSIPDTTAGTSNIIVSSAVNGGNVATSTLDVNVVPTTANNAGTGTATYTLSAGGENNTSSAADISFIANASGTGTNNNTFELEAVSQTSGAENTATGDVYVEADGIEGEATLNLTAITDAGQATVNITATGGSQCRTGSHFSNWQRISGSNYHGRRIGNDNGSDSQCRIRRN